MAANQSEASPYKSFFGGGFVSSGQYLAEVMCARMAKKQGKELPQHFWNLDAWKRTFLYQLRLANGLLKLYEPLALIAGLKRAKFVFSLNAKMVLDPLFKEEQEKLNRQREIRERNLQQPMLPAPTLSEPTKPREVYNHEKTLLSKLRNLD